MKEIGSVERVIQKTKGEVNEVWATPGWGRVRIQIGSGAIDTVGPKDIAGAFKMRETEMSKRGIGFVAANGSGIKSYGEKKIAGYTDDGEGVSMRVQCADVKNVLCSVHKMNLGCNVVVLDSGRSYMQNEGSGQKTKIHYKDGQYVMYLWPPHNRSLSLTFLSLSHLERSCDLLRAYCVDGSGIDLHSHSLPTRCCPHFIDFSLCLLDDSFYTPNLFHTAPSFLSATLVVARFLRTTAPAEFVL